MAMSIPYTRWSPFANRQERLAKMFRPENEDPKDKRLRLGAITLAAGGITAEIGAAAAVVSGNNGLGEVALKLGAVQLVMAAGAIAEYLVLPKINLNRGYNRYAHPQPEISEALPAALIEISESYQAEVFSPPALYIVDGEVAS